MGFNLQTFKDIRFYLDRELEGFYPVAEIKSITNIIIKSVTGVTKTHQIYLSDQKVTPEQSLGISRICDELKTGKPIQYILGETVFYDCRIKLNGATLIPRPETEEMVDIIIRENRNYTGNIIDFCTGSGCIAIAISLNIPGSTVTGTDISAEALQAAEESAIINRAKINLLQDDILNPDADRLGKAGLIVSNPPYVRNSEKLLMNKNVLDFEPHTALFVTDTDPLIYYDAILRKSAQILCPPGRIYFEINEALGESVVTLVESYGFRGIEILEDLNGKERIIKGIKYA